MFFSNKNETMFGSGYENGPEFGALGGVRKSNNDGQNTT
jgi:hypothetical protein